MGSALPRPTRPYIFQSGQAAVGDQVNQDLDPLYAVLSGGIGDAHIADNANISGTKIAAGSIPTAQFVDPYAMFNVGDIKMWHSDGTAVATGWQICDGSAITDSRSPRIGQNVANLVNHFPRGVANQNLVTTPVTGGEDTHTLIVSEMPVHNHTTTEDPNYFLYGGSATSIIQNGSGFSTSASTPRTGTAGSGAAHNNIPAYVGVVFIEKIF